jgi:hypothetical protein
LCNKQPQDNCSRRIELKTNWFFFFAAMYKLTDRKVFKKRVEHKKSWLFFLLLLACLNKLTHWEGLNTTKHDVLGCHGLTKKASTCLCKYKLYNSIYWPVCHTLHCLHQSTLTFFPTPSPFYFYTVKPVK